VYAPKVFRYLRSLDHIDEKQLILTLDPRENKNSIFKTNKGSQDGKGGRSGSFFFFT